MESDAPPTVGDIAARQHQMGLWACMSYVIANIVGAGIFITPGPILVYTQSNGLALIVWIGCGLISLIGGICYIELGTSILEPGCDFAYNVFVGWEGIAFSFMWVGVVMSFPASAAVQAQTFGQYIVAGLEPVWKLDEPWDLIFERGLGFTLIILLTILNLYSIDKYASKFQVVVTIAKLASLAVIMVTGFYFLIFQGWTQNWSSPFAGTTHDAGNISLAFYGALWSFAGWDILNYGTPEIHKPRRTMPIALLGGVGAVTAIYVAMNVAYMTVLTRAQIENSTAVAADFAQATLGNFSYAIPFMIAVLLVGTLNSNIFCGSRFTHAAAREGHLPTFLSCINPQSNSPRAALLFQLICTIVVTFVDTNSLINYVGFVMFAQRVVTMLALLWIRYRKIPVAEGAIRVPIIFSVIFFIITVVLVVVPIVEEPMETIVSVVLILFGLLLYFVFLKPKTLPAALIKFNDSLARITCRALFSVPDLKRRKPDGVSPRFTNESIVNNDELTTLGDGDVNVEEKI